MEKKFFKHGLNMDLHIHTNCSDGLKSVKDTLKVAEKHKLKTISITDHNTLKAYDEMKTFDVKKYFTGVIVPGVEINVIYNGWLVEVLAYNFEIEKLKNLKILNDDYQDKIQHAVALMLIKKADDYKLKYTLDFLEEKMLNAVGSFYKELKKHSENDWFFEKYKIKRNAEFYRKHFLLKDGSFYCNTENLIPNIKTVKKIVNDAGGLLVLAHPLKTYNFPHERAVVAQIAKSGLVDGLEVIHYNMTLSDTKFLMKLAEKYKLVQTAGSDYHGKENHVMGYAQASGLLTIIN